MLTYATRRIILAIPLLLGIAALNFLLASLAPGDPVIYLLADSADPALMQDLRERYGLDQPLWERFGAYISALLQGNLGQSIMQERPVLETTLERLPATMILAGAALIIAAGLGIPLGLWLAKLSLKNPRLERSAFLGILLSTGLPPFLLGQLLILLFALYLGLLPTSGMQSVRGTPEGLPRLLDLLTHLMLPAITLGLQPLATIARITRAQALEVMGQDFVTTARAKGLSERMVHNKHVLRNALPAPITLLALSSGHWVGGAVITETVFAWPGLGRLAVESTLARDYPLVIGVILVGAVGVILANLLADIAVAWLDPRVGYG
jgi:peptide/nickel transport system permease protein/oligopeptide transport system permease protein